MTEMKLAFLSTKRGRVIIGLVGLALAYIIGSRALDTGSIGQWFVTLGIFGLSIYELVIGIKNHQ